MAKVPHKSVIFTPEEMAYELPEHIDVSRLRHVGVGLEAVMKLIQRSQRTAGIGKQGKRNNRSSKL